METNITKYFIRHGLIYAIISVFLTLVLYLAGADFFANHMFLLGGLFIVIALAYPIIIVIQYRKMNGNAISFKEGFQITFFTLAIAGLITMVFGIILYHLIDPDYPKVLAEKIDESTITMMQNFGAPEEKIQEQIEKSNTSEKFSIQGQITSYLFSIAFYAILGLLVGVIFKKQEPVFPEPSN